MSVWIVQSYGGAWSNDDEAALGPAGVYSTREKAIDAVMSMMRNELQACGDSDMDNVHLDKLTFIELEEMWTDRMEVEPFTLHERKLDAGLCDVHEAGEGSGIVRPATVDVDGLVDAKGVIFLGEATLQPNGKYRCLANVGGALCIVEASVTEKVQE